MTRKGEPVGDACVVGWDKVPLERIDLEVLRQFGNFQRELMGALGPTPLEIVPNQELELLAQVEGFPIRVRRTKGGIVRSEILVRGVERLSLDAKQFEVPFGFVRRRGLGKLVPRLLPAKLAPRAGEPAGEPGPR